MGNKCTKYVKLILSDLDIDFDFKVISNSKILEEELNQWLKDKQKIPTQEDITRIQQNIEKIENYNLSGEELNKILSKKKKDRIKYKDSTLNVTEELDLALEKYRYNKEKYEEEKEKEKEREKDKGNKDKEEKSEKDKYFKIMKEIEEDIKQLQKMKEERDRKAKMNSENDIVAKINEGIRLKQKMDEKMSLLSRKRRKDRNDSIHKIFKRVDCHPTPLFDNQEINKEKKNEEKEIQKDKNEEEKEKKIKKKNNNISYAQKIKQLKEYIEDKKSLIDEMMEYEESKKKKEEMELKEKESNPSGKKENNIDLTQFFNLININYDVFNKMIKEQNKKNSIDPLVKIVGLNEYLNENEKE
jgi:hypothetical protein